MLLDIIPIMGCVIWRIRIIRRIVFNAFLPYWTNWAILYGCKDCRFMPIFGIFGLFPPQKRPFSELSILLHDIVIVYTILEKNWKRFGNWVILGRIGSNLGQVFKNMIVLYVPFVFGTCFTVLNVPSDRMTHPCSHFKSRASFLQHAKLTSPFTGQYARLP